MFKKVIALCLFLSACGLEQYSNGDLPTQQRLNSIDKNDTRDKVISILGVPASESPVFSDGSSFIVYAHTLKSSRAFLEPKELEGDTYVYYFNKDNKLVAQKHLTLADQRHLPYDTAETHVGGREVSLWEQLIQNFGRYNTGAQDSSVRR